MSRETVRSGVDAKLQELTMDSRGAPERIRGGHSYDKTVDRSHWRQCPLPPSD
jgi:hypothetical protein